MTLSSRSADEKPEFTARLLLDHIQLDHPCSRWTLTRPVDERLDSCRLSFEDRLNCAIIPIGHPARHPLSRSLATTAVPEEHALHTPMGHHSTTDHDTSLEDEPAQLPGTSSWRVSVRASTAPRDDTNGHSC